MPSLSTESRPARGILLMILAITAFSVMDACIKAADGVPPGQAVFFRSFFSLPVIVLWLVTRGEFPSGLRTANWKGHALRGLMGTAAMGLGFAGLRFLPLPEATALRFVTPILIIIFAALFLGERIRVIRITAVLTGLVGVCIILFPRLTASGQSSELLGAGLVLGSATLAAFVQIFVKSMVTREHTAAIVFYFAVTASIVSLATSPFGWVVPARDDLALLLSAALFGGIGQILVTSSYRFAEAGVVAPFTYVSMLWAILIGWLVFAELPTVAMLAGSGLIIASGIVIWLRERQIGRPIATEGKVRAKRMM